MAERSRLLSGCSAQKRNPGFKSQPLRQYLRDIYMRLANRFIILAVLGFSVLYLAGCAAFALHETEGEPEKKGDLGTKTELKLKGPKVNVTHSF